MRPATGSDAERIARFNRAMALETENLELAEDVARDGVLAVLADPGHGFYVVAECGPAVVGALLVTYEWSDWRNGRFWWIQSVYVEPAQRGRGVYRALHAFVRERAAAAGDVRGLRLYVERDNRAAQQVYRTLGMRASDYLLYEQEI